MAKQDCQNCISMFQEFSEGTLDVSGAALLQEHLGSCGECRDLLREFEQVTQALRASSLEMLQAPPLPNMARIMAAVGKEKRRRRRQWAGAAAVFLVFAGSGLLMNSGLFQPKEMEDMRLSSERSMDEAGDQSLDYGADTPEPAADAPGAVEEKSLATGIQENAAGSASPEMASIGEDSPGMEFLNQALTDPAFLAQVQEADQGYGYELVEYIQEGDGRFTFVLYFYEDDRRIVDRGEGGADWLASPNVRSFDWIKSE